MTSNWRNRIGYVTAAWSLAYGSLGIYWTLGGAGYPFGVGDPEMLIEPDFSFVVSLLGVSTPQVAGPFIAGLGFLGAVVGVLMARGVGRGPIRYVLQGIGWTIAAGLTVAIQDYRGLIVVAYTPILVVGKVFFGWPEGAGFGDLYLAPRLNLLMCLLAGLAWALTTIAYRRRMAVADGATEEAAAAPSARIASWGGPAVIVAMVVPLIYCATRWLWALGLPMGMPDDLYQEGKAEGLWMAGAGLATLGAGGAILTLGLIQRWGEVFPRWMIGLRGRRVPPMLALVPAIIVGTLTIAGGFMYIRKLIIGGLEPGWLIADGPETLWPLWGAGLIVAAVAYHHRRRLTSTVEG